MSETNWYTLTVDSTTSGPMTEDAARRSVARLRSEGRRGHGTRIEAPDRVCMVRGDGRACSWTRAATPVTHALGLVTCLGCLSKLTTKRRAWWTPPGLPAVVETLAEVPR